MFLFTGHSTINISVKHYNKNSCELTAKKCVKNDSIYGNQEMSRIPLIELHGNNDKL